MLEGETSQIDLIARLVELWREQFTGAIRFESDGIIKIIYFKGGDILSASTNDRADSVDEILMRAGKVSREHVKQALAKRKESETLGDALLNLGFITRKELTWARRVQVVGVIRSIAAWETGSFTIVADYLPKRDEGTLFPLPQVLVELIVTEQDRQKFERAMDGGAAVYEKTSDFDDVFRRLGLNEQAESIVEHIDGTKSVADVATASGGETFNVYKLMHALAILGILKRREGQQFSLDDFAAAGVADASDMWSEPEPQPQPTPMFELDEAEAVRQPTMEIRIPEEPETPAASAWDDETETAEELPPVPAPMPAWDTPPRQSAPMPIPVPVEPPAEAEEQWGFDEAQIETARRGTVIPPASTPPPPAMKRAKPARGSRLPLLIALMLVFILAGAGYFGFRYWQGLQEAPDDNLVVKRPAKTRPAPVPVQPTTTTTVAATTTTAAPTTSTVAATQTATQTTEPSVLPKVTPRPMTVAAPAASPTASAASPSRERYDAMARDFAANASGNYTVQIQILCDPLNLGKAMNAGGENVWFVPQSLGARSCYRVFWGRFNTRDEAQRALAEVPAGLRDPSAAVKAVPKG